MKTKLLLTVLPLAICGAVKAQDWVNVQRNYGGESWTIPLRIEQFSQFDFSDDETSMRGYTQTKDGAEMVMPFSVEYLESLTLPD